MKIIILLQIAITLLVNLNLVEALYECCPNENVLFLSNRSCLNAPIDTEIDLNCPLRYPITELAKLSDYGFKLLYNGTLINELYDEMPRYCQAKKGDYPEDDTPMYIVCADSDNNDFEENQFTAQAILGLISAMFVILTIIVYSMIPSLLDLEGICIMHTLVALAVGYITLGIIQLESAISDNLCKLFAYLVYISFIYLFLWLVVLSFHIWRTTVQPRLENKTNKWKVIYHAFAIVGTTIAVIFVTCGHYSPSEFWNEIRPGFGEVSCWFQSPKVIWIYFYGPIVVLLTFNVILYMWTLTFLCTQIQDSHSKVSRYRLKLGVKLCIIMGITWIFEIFTFILKNHKMHMAGKIMLCLLDLFNVLQGILIFLVLVVFRKRVRRALATKTVCNMRFPSSWNYLEDEEMDNTEKTLNHTHVVYIGVEENAHAELT